MSGTSVIVEVPVCKVVANPWQVRQLDADLVGELTTAMRENGFRGVLVGRAIWVDGSVVISDEEHLQDIQMDLDCGNALIQLAWGHHRLEAATAAGIEDVPVELVGGLTDEQMASWALMENVRRKDISPIEEAQAIQRLTEEFHWTQARVAEMLGYKDAATVSNKLRLLRLPEEIQQKVSTGQMPERTARSLVGLAEISPKRMKEVAEMGREVTEWDVKQAKRDATRPLSSPAEWDRAPWPMEWVPAALDVEGDGSAISCQGCDKHMDLDSMVRCTDPKCWKKRNGQWEAQAVALESEKQGVPPVQEGEKAHFFNWQDRDLLGDRCKTVNDGKVCHVARLCFKDTGVVLGCGSKEGYDHCVQQIKAQRKSEDERWDERKTQVRELLLKAADRLGTQQMLALHVEVCRVLKDHMVSAMGWDEPDGLDAHTALAWKVLTRTIQGLPARGGAEDTGRRGGQDQGSDGAVWG